MKIKEDIFDVKISDKIIKDNLTAIEKGGELTIPLKVLKADPKFKLAYSKKFGPLEEF